MGTEADYYANKDGEGDPGCERSIEDGSAKLGKVPISVKQHFETFPAR